MIIVYENYYHTYILVKGKKCYVCRIINKNNNINYFITANPLITDKERKLSMLK